MSEREPLAALVARLAALPPHFKFSGAAYEVDGADMGRLLAAVEAGTKCAEAIGTVLRSGPDAIVGGRAEFRGIPERGIRGSVITVSFDEMREALADWKRVAEPVAPASHGSPEQGR